MIYRVEGSGLFDVKRGGGNSKVFWFFSSFFFPPLFFPQIHLGCKGKRTVGSWTWQMALRLQGAAVLVHHMTTFIATTKINRKITYIHT